MSDRVELGRLRRQFQLAGWHIKPTGRLLGDLALQLLITAFGLAIVIVSDRVWLDAAGLLVATIGAAGVATHTHSSSHFATSSRRWVNNVLTYFGYPFFTGLSASYWRYKHLAVHHRAPNVVGVDEDADLSPWFALTRDQADQARAIPRFYYRRLQAWIFPVALMLNGFNIQKSGWIFVVKRLAGSNRRTEHWVDLACLVGHYVLWIGVPLLWFPLQDVLLVYLIRIVLMGYAMFAILAPGHFPAEALRTRPDSAIDAIALQTSATVNFRTGWLGSLMCCGLEYQIEHHLFPDVAYVHYPALSAVVKQFCAERNLPYRSYPWPVALWKSWKVVLDPSYVEHAQATLQWDA